MLDGVYISYNNEILSDKQNGIRQTTEKCFKLTPTNVLCFLLLYPSHRNTVLRNVFYFQELTFIHKCVHFSPDILCQLLNVAISTQHISLSEYV